MGVIPWHVKNPSSLKDMELYAPPIPFSTAQGMSSGIVVALWEGFNGHHKKSPLGPEIDKKSIQELNAKQCQKSLFFQVQFTW